MPTMRDRVAELHERRAKVREMGGPEKVAKHHERGKLTARERLALLFDGGAFPEVGLHATERGPGGQTVPADAVVCGWGKVNGRNVAAAAYDFTVKGGSIGFSGETKVTRMRELALRNRMPMVWLIDSAGARIAYLRALPAEARLSNISAYFISPGLGPALDVESTVIQQGRSLAVVRTSIRAASGKLVLEASSQHVLG